MMRLFTALLIALLLVSCEFESDKEFFRDIEKPGDIMVGLDLAGVNPNDPVYIYDDTKIYFTLNNSGKRVLSQEVMVNGEVVYMTGGDYIIIFKDQLSKSVANTLKFTFRLKTDSGSLADIMNAEYYEGEFMFQLVPVDNAFNLGVREGITNDGYFMLEWDRPGFEQLEIAGYEIKFRDFSGTDKTVVLDGAANSFVDKDYVGGYRSYSITMKFAGEKIKDKTLYYNMSYTGMTSDDIKIEFKDLVSTKLTWKSNKYRCSYFILHNRNDAVVGSASYETPEAVLQAPEFPEESGFYTLIAAPDNYVASDISYKSGGIEKFYKYEAPPSDLDMAINSYIVDDMLIYGRSGNTVKVGDAATLKTIKSYNSPFFENLTSVSVSPNSNKLLLFIGYDWGFERDNKVYLYDNKNDLSGVPAEVKTPKANSQYKRIELISDDLIFIESSLDGDGINTYLILISAITGETIEVMATNLYNNIDLSYDGKRIAVTDRGGFKVNIYDITEMGFELFNSIPLNPFYNPDDLLFCVINPKDSDQLLFWSTTARRVLVLDVASGKSGYIDGVFKAVDPFTGRVFCLEADRDNNSIMYVYNSSDIEQPALSFRAHDYGLNVYNDFLLMYNGCFNISNYIK